MSLWQIGEKPPAALLGRPGEIGRLIRQALSTVRANHTLSNDLPTDAAGIMDELHLRLAVFRDSHHAVCLGAIWIRFQTGLDNNSVCPNAGTHDRETGCATKHPSEPMRVLPGGSWPTAFESPDHNIRKRAREGPKCGVHGKPTDENPSKSIDAGEVAVRSAGREGKTNRSFTEPQVVRRVAQVRLAAAYHCCERVANSRPRTKMKTTAERGDLSSGPREKARDCAIPHHERTKGESRRFV
jgi:hypothetical protein